MSSFIVRHCMVGVETSFSDKQYELLEKKIVGSFAICTPEGYPHLTPVWIILQDDKIYFTSTTNQKKYTYIKNNSKVGLTIQHPKVKNFFSIYGEAEIRYREEYNEYDYVVERIVRKYVSQEKVKEVMSHVLEDENRILVEISPTRIYPSH